MGFWSRLLSAFQTETKAGSPEAWWEEFGYQSRSSTGLPVNQFSTLSVTTANACKTVLCEDVGKLPLHLYQLVNGERKIVEDHPLEKLFRHPNDWQTRFEFIEMMMACLVLRGNAYACIVRDWRGTATMLVPVNPDRVWIYEAPDGEVFYQVARRGMHDMAVLKSLPLMVPAEDMLHIRDGALDSSLWGLSRVTSTREAIGLSLAQQELAARLAGNGTNLGGYLTTDQKLGEPAAKRMADDWKQRYGGLRNAGGTPVLEQGLKFEPIGMTSVDAEFLNSRKFSVEEIARIFRVPLHKIGVMGAHATGTSLVQLDQEYLNSTLSSWCERISLKFAQTFGIESPMFVAFDYSDFLKADLMTRLQAARLGVLSMIYTPNEQRAAMGLPPVPGGNTLMQPVNMAPFPFIPSVGTEEAGQGSDQTGEGAPGGNGDPGEIPPDSAPNV